MAKYLKSATSRIIDQEIETIRFDAIVEETIVAIKEINFGFMPSYIEIDADLATKKVCIIDAETKTVIAVKQQINYNTRKVWFEGNLLTGGKTQLQSKLLNYFAAKFAK